MRGLNGKVAGKVGVETEGVEGECVGEAEEEEVEEAAEEDKDAAPTRNLAKASADVG